ncbi:MAG: segregation/condensation protein A [Ignavibacteriaceae bacterium]|jgi:segregation and condensation protein A|nr:segregation/condensation protein A [Ignavibacteriaceae bacterium]
MYKIKLEQFEGPLDLLLFFIKRDELNIYDIPISKITKEFLEYVNLIKMLDLETAGDFILMASTLMHIKVRMLLPREFDESGEEIDPRADLIKALLEYKKYKEVAEDLTFLESNQQKLRFRGYFSEDEKEKPGELEILLKNVSIYDLAKAFKQVIDGVKPEIIHQISRPNITIDEQIEYILEMVENEKELLFTKLVLGMTEKLRIIVTFIALLELVKIGRIGIKTTKKSNEFIIHLISNG